VLNLLTAELLRASLNAKWCTYKTSRGDDVRKCSLLSAAIIALVSSGWARAADVTIPSPSTYNWTGLYAGVTAGAAFGQYDADTSANVSRYFTSSAVGGINAAGAETVRPVGFATGIEGGYNWQTGSWLLGVEGDLQALNLQGSTSGSSAVPFRGITSEFAITSYGDASWLFTARPRIGFVAPNHWLFYASGGVALTELQADFSFVDVGMHVGGAESGRIDTTKIGYVIGAGIEAPLTDRLSVKADYVHVGFGATPGVSTANTIPGQGFIHSGDLSADILRAGLNYHFGGADPSTKSYPIGPFKAPNWKMTSLVLAGLEVEVGTRLWFSSGLAGALDPFLDNPPPGTYGSRLTFSNLDAISGETFGRVEHSSGFFVKGYLGAGGILNAKLNDEDSFDGDAATLGAYSNTLASATGHIGYATIDAGYDFFRVSGAKLGAFLGYNYYAQAINSYGCSQLAGSAICVPAFPSNLLGPTENDNYNSLRVGLTSQITLIDRLKLTAEAAYVPLVAYSGLVNHLPTQTFYLASSNSGDGVMLEATLDYAITDAWSVGIGGRYWAWNINTGQLNIVSLTNGTGHALAGVDAERYGMFLQTSYRWGDAASTAAADALPAKAPVLTAGPMTWTGPYVGGHLGGGLSNDNWADPFVSRMSNFSHTNVAGFGDTTHATGPLVGGQVGFNLQMGHLVLGAEVNASAASIRGQNTCFSGLGGVNCQHNVTSLGSLTGRIGYSWDRSLAYVKAGAAWTDTTYTLLGNAPTLGGIVIGSGSAGADVWGWTVGGGIEYAFTNHWTAFTEYDHIGVPSTTVEFPTVSVVNTAPISVRQSVDLFKLGVNYKFELASLGLLVAQK
jgi:opacity protein-like surface antigen